MNMLPDSLNQNEILSRKDIVLFSDWLQAGTIVAGGFVLGLLLFVGSYP
jgi:hypothetical protein